MKDKQKLKLSQLNKDSIEDGKMSRLMGGNYCAFSYENADANASSGVCSCVCSGDYYGSNGLEYYAAWYRDTTFNGYGC